MTWFDITNDNMKEYTKTFLFKLAKKDDSSLLSWPWCGQRYDFDDSELLDINGLEVNLMHSGEEISVQVQNPWRLGMRRHEQYWYR